MVGSISGAGFGTTGGAIFAAAGTCPGSGWTWAIGAGLWISSSAFGRTFWVAPVGVSPSSSFGTVGSLVGWYVWAFLTYIIGTKLLPEAQTHADHGELLRTIGFASSPGLIRLLAIIPGVGTIVDFLASGWMLVAMVVAVRQALDYESTYRAIGVCLIGWLAQAALLMLMVMMMGGPPEPL
mgnify:CR=1 FL=1